MTCFSPRFSVAAAVAAALLASGCASVGTDRAGADDATPPIVFVHGNGDSAAVHNPRYQFNDAAIPYGAALYAQVVEQGLKKAAG